MSQVHFCRDSGKSYRNPTWKTGYPTRENKTRLVSSEDTRMFNNFPVHSRQVRLGEGCREKKRKQGQIEDRRKGEREREQKLKLKQEKEKKKEKKRKRKEKEKKNKKERKRSERENAVGDSDSIDTVNPPAVPADVAQLREELAHSQSTLANAQAQMVREGQRVQQQQTFQGVTDAALHWRREATRRQVKVNYARVARAAAWELRGLYTGWQPPTFEMPRSSFR